MVSSLQRLFSIINHNNIASTTVRDECFVMDPLLPLPAIHVYWVRFSAFLHTLAGTAQVHTILLPMCTKWWLVAISYVSLELGGNIIYSKSHTRRYNS